MCVFVCVCTRVCVYRYDKLKKKNKNTTLYHSPLLITTIAKSNQPQNKIGQINSHYPKEIPNHYNNYYLTMQTKSITINITVLNNSQMDRR